MRKLAKVIIIDEISPIEGADRIELVKWDGWQVVAQKGKHYVGEKAVAFEIDSFLPEKPEFEFLRKSSFRQTSNLGNGFRLKTCRLKGEISQGLVMSLSELGLPENLDVGDDLTEILEVQKWEMPVPANLRGEMKGYIPFFLKKTDQERVQNVDLTRIAEHVFETTLKLDGSSMTVFLDPETGEMGVCSRNLHLKINEENIEKNTFVKTAMNLSLGWKLREAKDYTYANLAFQGELVGPGIQKNSCGLSEYKFYIFDIWNIDHQRYMSSPFRRALCADLELDHVPVLSTEQQISHLTRKNLIDMADDLTSPFRDGDLNIKIPEGMVYKSILDPNLSFKVISNRYLIKNDK